MFASLLIANRGEIARRVIRTARRLGVRTVAVYTDADRSWPHWREADEALRIGEGPAATSYLDIATIVGAARRAGVEAVHPGYGFLSENADFAEACDKAGLVFVGPPAEAIRAMGSKARARALMEEAGVPVVPGFHGSSQAPGALAAEADRIGYPVLIKAVAGGGGRGMRRVEARAEFAAALESAQREAVTAFGDGRVLVERFVAPARHVEVQVLADAHGNAVHLLERDCSVQRRHQKVVEEAPAPRLPESMRVAMCTAAVTAATAVGYRGAGTVEFIVDASGGEERFHFLEMNTRLQVEHPVTEMITGLDLVEWQLRVAAGEALPFAQSAIAANGHAIEARLCAEDPAAGFRPSTGRIHKAAMPEGEGVRADSGVADGCEVTAHYDSLLAKVIAHGATREEARGRLAAALRGTWIAGPRTNQAFLAAVVTHPAFVAGGVDTGFAADNHAELAGAAIPDWAVAEAVRVFWAGEAEVLAKAGPPGPWARTDGFEIGGLARAIPTVMLVDGAPVAMDLMWQDKGIVVPVGGRNAGRQRGPHFRFLREGRRAFAIADGVPFEISLPDASLADPAAAGGSGVIRAPMHGRVLAVAVAPGDPVETGDPLFVVEAMKMENTVTAPVAGTVVEVVVAPGDQVADGALAVRIGPSEPPGPTAGPDGRGKVSPSE